jgi:DNA-binding MarR family transcriptional regulator
MTTPTPNQTTETTETTETAQAPQDHPALDFSMRLARAHAAMVRRLDNSLGSYFGISFNDFQLLLYLSHAPAGRLRRVDLAECMGLTASGVTRALLPLEKIGLVTRQPDPRDARIGYAVLTEAGHTLAFNATGVVQTISQNLLRDIAPEALPAMSAMLGQLAGMNANNASKNN